jgi:P2 family phage major capsid protein
MQNSTRQVYTGYIGQVAKLNGVADATVKFAVDPSIQQKLETAVQESSDFLKKINIIGVDEAQGSKLGLGVGSSIASTTDTALKDRETTDPTGVDENGYHCRQTNFDSHVTYAKLDAWAKFKDFQTRMRNALVIRQALDRITIGFNGRTRAATSDRAANPMLQDVGIGWLQKYRTHAPARVLKEGSTVNKIRVGAGGDYRNLDALVMDAVANLIAPWHQSNPALVAVVSRDLLHDKYFPIVNTTDKPTEQLAAQLIVSQRRLGNLPAVAAPFFPAGSVFITTFDNLSVYYQLGGRRRQLVDNAKRDRIENFESSNDDYVVEDYDLGCLIENIEILAPAEGA